MTNARQHAGTMSALILAKTIDNGCTEGGSNGRAGQSAELMAAYDIETELGNTVEHESAIFY